MKKVFLKSKDIQSDGEYYFRVKEVIGEHFFRFGFLRCDESLYEKFKEGDEVELPGAVYKLIEWAL